jgi:hypothetical protein
VGLGAFTEHDYRACDALVKLVSPMFRVPMPR